MNLREQYENETGKKAVTVLERFNGYKFIAFESDYVAWLERRAAFAEELANSIKNRTTKLALAKYEAAKKGLTDVHQ